MSLMLLFPGNLVARVPPAARRTSLPTDLRARQLPSDQRAQALRSEPRAFLLP
jgi:hypothetical protein